MISAATDRRAREAMADYLSAGARFDIDALAATYAPEFINVRLDPATAPVVLDRAVMVGHLRRLAATGARLEAAADARILAVSACGRYVSVTLGRTKHAEEFVYDFVWDLGGERPRIVRELTARVPDDTGR